MLVQPIWWTYDAEANTLTALVHEAPTVPDPSGETFTPSCGFLLTIPVEAAVVETYSHTAPEEAT
jgi:hypothetical protein